MRIRKSRRLTVSEFESIDEAIIDVLRSNGRATNQEIADRLSITAGTVSARLARLDKSRAMRVVAVADFSAHGFNVLIALGIKVLGRTVNEVARDLCELPEVFSLHVMNGPYDIEILATLHDFDEVEGFLLDRASQIPGVAAIETSTALEIAKFEFGVAPL